MFFTAVLELTIGIIFKFASVLIYSPIFLVPGVIVAGLGYWIGTIYMAAQLPVKREMSNARAPVYSHFNASMAGLTSIRAFGAEDTFKLESKKRIDAYTKTARPFYDLNRYVRSTLDWFIYHIYLINCSIRWVCVRVDGLSGLFSASLAAYLVYGKSQCWLRWKLV